MNKYKPKPRWEDWPNGRPVHALPLGRLSQEDEDDEANSLPRQQAMCEDAIRRQGWICEKWEEDLISGFTSDPRDRKGYQRQLARGHALANRGEAVVIVVKDVDRFGRQGGEGIIAYYQLEEAGIRFWTVRDRRFLDFQDFAHRAIQAEQESRNTSNRIRDYVAEKRSAGWWVPKTANWGYTIVPTTKAQRAEQAPKVTLGPADLEAPKVRELFERFRGGASYHALARWCATLSEAERGGRALTTTQVCETLRNPLYVGDTADGGPGRWPALVDRELWNAVQARRANLKQELPHQASGHYLLTGLLWCSCGARMGGHSLRRGNGERYSIYRCTAPEAPRGDARACYLGAAGERLERIVDAKVKRILGAILRDPEGIEDMAERWDELTAEAAGPSPAQALAKARARLGELQTEIGELGRRRLLPESHAKYVADWEYAPTRDAIGAEIKGLNEEIARLEDASREAEAPEMTLRELLERLTGPAGEWDTLPVPAKRPILAELVTRIVPLRRPGGGRVYDAEVHWSLLGDALWQIATGQYTPEAPEQVD